MVETTTIALVRLVEGKNAYSWRVIRCPYCLKPHTHGAGYLSGDPRRLLGPRRSHCLDASVRGDYDLVEVKI